MRNLQDLKNEFLKAAIIHEETTKSGNYKLGNKQIEIVGKIDNKLQSSVEGRKILREFMFHPNPSARLWAAGRCLFYFPKEALNILKELEDGESAFYSIHANLILEMWKNGELNFDSHEGEKTDNEDEGEGLDLEVFNIITSSEKMEHEEKYIKSLNQGMQMVYATLELEREVQNGGFNQYFWNTFPGGPELVRNGYKLIGAEGLVKLLDEAVKLFMNELPKNEKHIKENTTQSFVESYNDTDLEELDERFEVLIEKENPSKLRESYIASHLEEFNLPN